MTDLEYLIFDALLPALVLALACRWLLRRMRRADRGKAATGRVETPERGEPPDAWTGDEV